MITAAGILSGSWTCDDAFISFRYAENFAAGLGLTYNPSLNAPVEGYSNTLWVLISALVSFLNLPLALSMNWLSLVCALFLCHRIYRTLIQTLELAPLQAALITAIASLSPTFLVWGTSGLATMPFALCLFLAYESCCLNKTNKVTVAEALALVALVLIRAEGFAWAVVIILLALVFNPSRRGAVVKVLIPTLLLTLAVLFTARYSYYGALMPNTASAKVGFSLARVLRGADYVLVYLLTFLTPVAGFLAVVRFKALWNKKELLVAFLLFTGIFSYSILVGGDYMSMGRFLLPSLPFQALLVGALLHTRTKLIYAFGPVLVAVSLLPLCDIYLVPAAVKERFHFRLNRSSFVNESDHWRFMKANAARWRKKGTLLKQIAQPGDSLVEGAIGNVGYFSGLTIYDRMGLVSRIPKASSTKKLRSPGHDIRVPDVFFLNKEPTYLFAKYVSGERLKGTINSARRKKYPFPYSPVVLRDDASGNSSSGKPWYLVLMKRHSNRESYEQAWSDSDAEWKKTK